MKTLTLDLGTRNGWTLLEDGIVLQSNTLLLATPEELEEQRRTGKERTLDVRFSRLLDFIRGKIREGAARIVFEDVLFNGVGSFHTNQLWAGLRTAIWTVTHDTPSLQVFGVPVGTLKAFAFGKGTAKKEEMAQALAKVEPARYQLNGLQVTDIQTGRTMDDNEVDAIWLAKYTISVDRGERDFMATYERRQKAKAEKLARRAERRAAQKVKAKEEKQKGKIRGLIKMAKATGKCCGVFRKPSKGWAICPKCKKAVRMSKAEDPAPPVALPPTAPVVVPSPVVEAKAAVAA
jgi:hypothetical protein